MILSVNMEAFPVPTQHEQAIISRRAAADAGLLKHTITSPISLSASERRSSVSASHTQRLTEHFDIASSLSNSCWARTLPIPESTIHASFQSNTQDTPSGSTPSDTAQDFALHPQSSVSIDRLFDIEYDDSTTLLDMRLSSRPRQWGTAA